MTATADLAPLLAGFSGVTLGADVISANLGKVPAGAFGALGLYVTQVGGGSGFIAATPAQLAAHPDCVKYGQLPVGDPLWADVLDKENGAATDAEVPVWAKGALASFVAGTHPGQRSPCIYVSASGVTQVANDLVAAGVKTGIGFIIANWNLTESTAAADVLNGSGPFPVRGIQFADPGPYDLDVYSTAWLNARSGPKPPPATTYGAPLDLTARAGHTNVALAWKPPGTPGLPAPAGYLVWVYSGTRPSRTTLLPSYNPARHVTGLSHDEGSLVRGRTYTVHVSAAGKNGTMLRPFTYAEARFTTG